MSRIGKLPIKIENGVTLEIQDGGRYLYKKVLVKGPKGELSEDIRRGINLELKDGELLVSRINNSKENRSLHGLYRSLINNMVDGVTKGYSKVLEMHGVGYRAAVKGTNLELKIELNHPVVIEAPEGITFSVNQDTEITISGINKQVVGETAASIRALRKPEPYKGKGIRYSGEFVRRKAGKSAGSA
jgi:large subunit ribosomal protein L6